MNALLHAPRRIVSLVPSLTESLFDLRAGERVVGVTDFCIHPAGALANVPRVGGPKTPDIPQIIDLHPELVIANREENCRADVEALQAAGVEVWVTYPRTVQETLAMLWQLLQRLHLPDGSASLHDIETQLEAVTARSSNGELVRVFCPVWRDPWLTLSADTYTHDLLRVCGGWNVFADWPGTRYPSVTLDDVTALAPDVILLPDDPYPFDETHLPELNACDVPAVQNGRVHLVDGSMLTWYGTRLGRALQLVPQWLRPLQS